MKSSDKTAQTFLTACCAFFCPIVIMVLCYFSIGIFPGSQRSILASDAFSQFANFHASFHNMLKGEQSIFYTWSGSLGLNYLSLIAYYLGGIFTPLVFFFPNEQIPDTLYFLTLLKIGSASLSFWYFSKKTYQIPSFGHIFLAVSYSLMSFITAHSELIMWLDTFVWLPLIILGIHRLMDQHKPGLLFVSYVFLFVSNFYFGFMVGVFSLLYFLARTVSDWQVYKKKIVPYFLTSFLAGGSAMFIILPTYFDLKFNGEQLDTLNWIKTEGTSWLDLIAKQFIGAYDTTKYGSVPFIYVGLLPLILMFTAFLSKKIKRKLKLSWIFLFTCLIASFYIEPFNLFWHGFHSPNMFLFRYSFLFSFLVILIAGYGLETIAKKHHFQPIYLVSSILILTFLGVYFLKPHQSYPYLNKTTLALSCLFVCIYALVFMLYEGVFHKSRKRNFSKICVLLFICVSLEAGMNTYYMLSGILADWNYASRSLFTQPYPDIVKNLKTSENHSQPNEFFRVENLEPVSSNDSFTYQYSGVSLFSSIRNRNSNQLLNDLGFPSRKSQLNIRYQHNTLVMDSLLGIQYKLSQSPLNTYQFSQLEQTDSYRLYHNPLALDLGMLTTQAIKQVPIEKNQMLMNQQNILNQLAQKQQALFTKKEPSLVNTTNAYLQRNQKEWRFFEKKANHPQVLSLKTTIPKGKQAYVAIYPKDFSKVSNTNLTVKALGQSSEGRLDLMGSYYDLGYFSEETPLSFQLEFYGENHFEIEPPKIILLDTKNYEQQIKHIQAKTIKTNVKQNQVTFDYQTEEDKPVIFTTIPYDLGWQVKIDQKKATVQDFHKGFILLDVPSGKHTVTLTFYPYGIKLGASISLLSIGLFLFLYKYKSSLF